MPISWPIPRPAEALQIVKQIKGFSAFSSLFPNNVSNVSVDSLIFKLHCSITVFILLVGTIFISMRHYFGDPIECLTSRNDIPPALVQHYCWSQSTYTVTGQSNVNPKSLNVGMQMTTTDSKKNEQKYYQWVYFILILQGMLFYTPKYMWKAKEDKRLRDLIIELRSSRISEYNDYDRNRLIEDVQDSLLISNDYFKFFTGCEIFCVIHVLIEIWFTHIFLGGSFFYLGLEWLFYFHNELDTAQDPLIRIFPRITKCTFQKVSMSNELEPIQALCFLPLNVINEKLFVILWFWYFFLITISVLILMQRCAYLLIPELRFQRLKKLAPSTNKKFLKNITRKVGHYFVLKLIANHMKPSHFRDLIDIVMEVFYDKNGKVLPTPVLLPAAPPNETNTKTKRLTKNLKSKLDTIPEQSGDSNYECRADYSNSSYSTEDWDAEG